MVVLPARSGLPGPRGPPRDCGSHSHYGQRGCSPLEVQRGLEVRLRRETLVGIGRPRPEIGGGLNKRLVQRAHNHFLP